MLARCQHRRGWRGAPWQPWQQRRGECRYSRLNVPDRGRNDGSIASFNEWLADLLVGSVAITDAVVCGIGEG
jgi:hypothetical protein